MVALTVTVRGTWLLQSEMSQRALLRAMRGLGNGSTCVQGLSQLLPGAGVFLNLTWGRGRVRTKALSICVY